MHSLQQHNRWMLFAFGAAAWAIAMGGHELIGHGGLCMLDPGCEWIYADAMYFDGTRREGWWLNLQRASGSTFNVVLALASAWFLKRGSVYNAGLRVFLWLLIPVNLFHAGSYIGFGWLIHEGMDWARLSQQFSSALLGRTLVSLLGGCVIVLGFYLSRHCYPYSDGRSATIRQKVQLMGIPYLACALVSTWASLMMPGEDRWFLLSGGLGGSLGFLMWMPLMVLLPGPEPRSNKMTANVLSFNAGGFIVALALAAAYMLVLGPGVNFS